MVSVVISQKNEYSEVATAVSGGRGNHEILPYKLQKFYDDISEPEKLKKNHFLNIHFIYQNKV